LSLFARVILSGARLGPLDRNAITGKAKPKGIRIWDARWMGQTLGTPREYPVSNVRIKNQAVILSEFWRALRQNESKDLRLFFNESQAVARMLGSQSSHYRWGAGETTNLNRPEADHEDRDPSPANAHLAGKFSAPAPGQLPATTALNRSPQADLPLQILRVGVIPIDLAPG